ncbi:MAG: tRNA glutamyl-Q(34) synthetase GluQRS [Methylophilaceae bacterium]
MPYIGRFAPSPTGPLHFGSLIAAVASYCDAKANQGQWLVRMEDLDKPREMQGAADTILHQLSAFGFMWDDNVIYQSQRAEFYEEALQTLQKHQQIYSCTCSRKEIVDSAIATGTEGSIYPKTCLINPPKYSNHAAYRLAVPDTNIIFMDAIQGEIKQNLARDIGDFVLKRADGLFAYQLAVVVDDALQNITHIVRGADLLASTPRQIYLQQLLNFSTPHYAHVPVAVNTAGEKLSKQTFAKPIELGFASALLTKALLFLGQKPPADLVHSSLIDIWQWAIANWTLCTAPKLNIAPYTR